MNLLPTSPTALRICAVMHRQLTTKWTLREISAFRRLLPIAEDELMAVERYYKWHWPPSSGKNVLRHDMGTLINNWAGEVDRARIWWEKRVEKPKYIRKIIPLPVPVEQQMTEAEREEAAVNFEKLMGRRPHL